MRRVAYVLFGVLAGATTSASAGSGPSFDCMLANTPIEQAICSDGEDTASDRELAVLYKQIMARLHGDLEKNALRDSQRAWVKRRDTTCASPQSSPAIGTCLRPIYAQRLNELNNWGRPRLPAEMMHDEALASAYGEGLSDVTFVSAAFSPDGTILALAAGRSGAPETVWLYDLESHTLLAATAVPTKGGSAAINRFYWVGTVLYGEIQFNFADAAPVPIHFAATMAGGRNVDQIPPAPAVPGQAKDVTNASAASQEKMMEDAHYSVSAVNNGHGSFSLNYSDGKREYTILNGGSGLAQFLFDAPRKRVLYQNNEGTLSIYDLSGHRDTAYAVPIGSLLDISPDGAILAASTPGACQGAMDFSAPVQHICFLQLPR